MQFLLKRLLDNAEAARDSQPLFVAPGPCQVISQHRADIASACAGNAWDTTLYAQRDTGGEFQVSDTGLEFLNARSNQVFHRAVPCLLFVFRGDDIIGVLMLLACGPKMRSFLQNW